MKHLLSEEDHNSSLSNYHLLILAVIQQAIADLLHRPVGKEYEQYKLWKRNRASEPLWHRNKDEAREWLFDITDCDGKRVLSVQWCCDAVGMNIHYLHKQIRLKQCNLIK